MFQEIKFEEFIELWGERFSRSKLGLNEDQVKAFIGRLIGEREILLERDRQFREIALKAEKITLEADKIAIEARKKAGEQAKLILDGAREQAEKLVRQKLVEAETAARQEAELIKKEAVAAAQKCIDEAEGKAQANAKAIIMKALVEGNEIIEKKRAEAGDVGRDGTEAIETDLLAAAKRLLANASEEAEAQAEAQAEAILSSKKTTGEP